MAAEIKAGDEAAAEIAKSAKFVTDPAIVARINDIGQKIAVIANKQQVPAGFGTSAVYPFHYTYKIINEKDVNAFSLPGGHIYIYKGLLDLLSTDDEIAGVLGHETAHAAHHHISELTHESNKMTTGMLLGALVAVLAHVPAQDLGALATVGQMGAAAELNNKYSETAEEDADHTGMIYMQKAGYSPVGVLALMYRLKSVEDRSPDIPLGYLQDHPLTAKRIEAARAELNQLDVPVTPAAMNAVSGNIARVEDSAGASSVAIGTQVLFKVALSNHDEAMTAANRLNQLLGNNLQGYEVRSVGPILIVRGTPLAKFTSADQSALSVPGKTPSAPDALAQAAAHSIQLMLWNKLVTSTTDQEIEIAPTNPYDPTQR